MGWVSYDTLGTPHACLVPLRHAARCSFLTGGDCDCAVTVCRVAGSTARCSMLRADVGAFGIVVCMLCQNLGSRLPVLGRVHFAGGDLWGLETLSADVRAGERRSTGTVAAVLAWSTPISGQSDQQF